MAEFEFLANVTIGQCLPTGSVLHQLDPRVKLLAFILLVGVVSFTSTLSGNVVLLLIIAGLFAVARIAFPYALRGLRPFLPWIAAFAAFQLLFTSGGGFVGGTDCRALLDWWAVGITSCSVKLVLVSTMRFIALYLLVSLLTFTTSTTELGHGTERLLNPFARFGVPAHELALVLTIALRFVPTLAQEAERLVKAQVSRGADFGGAGRWRFVRRTRQMLPLLVPLFLNSLRRAEVLSLAMEARCYGGGKGRTHLIELKSSPLDYLALAMTVALAVFMMTYNFTAIDAVLGQFILLNFSLWHISDKH